MLQLTGSEFALLNPACFKHNRKIDNIKVGAEEVLHCLIFVIQYLLCSCLRHFNLLKRRRNNLTDLEDHTMHNNQCKYNL